MLGFMFSTARALTAAQGQQTRQRLALGGLTAGLLGFALIMIVVAQFPLCVLYEPGSVEWYTFLCFLG